MEQYLAGEDPSLLSHGLQNTFEVGFHNLGVFGLPEDSPEPGINQANLLHDGCVGVQHIGAVNLCAPGLCNLGLQLQWAKKRKHLERSCSRMYLYIISVQIALYIPCVGNLWQHEGSVVVSDTSTCLQLQINCSGPLRIKLCS